MTSAKPDDTGRISETWINNYIDTRYGLGAAMMFRDLIELGLIREDKINWDGSGSGDVG